MSETPSSKEVTAHLRKWEKTVTELNSLCREHRRVLRTAGAVTPTGASSENAESSKAEVLEAPSTERRMSHSFSIGKRDNIMAMSDENCSPADPERERERDMEASQVSGRKQTRSRAVEARKARLDLYQSYQIDDAARDTLAKSTTVAGTHFAVVAAGLSYLLGGSRDGPDRRQRVTIEDLFFAAQVPLHCLHNRSFELAEMFDVVREFVDVDNRFKDEYTVEVLHMDVTPATGQVERGAANEVGTRQRKVQIADLRRQLEDDLATGDAVTLVQFDPFMVEQDVKPDEDGGANGADLNPLSVNCERANFGGKDGQDGAGFITHRNLRKDNDGMFAVVADMRQKVTDMVTIAEATFTDALHVNLVEIPFATLFNSTCLDSPQQQRARGFIRIAKRQVTAQDEPHPEVGWFFSPELCSGKVLGSTSEGIHAHAVLPTMSPHITACGWALHFLHGQRPGRHLHGQGLPVSDIIRTLKLPTDMYLQCDLPLEQVYLYFQEYLEAKGLDERFQLQMCPVITTVSRADAVPTQTQSELETLLIELDTANDDTDRPAHVMIIQYDANIAHNALGVATEAQWGVLVGFNVETQEVRVIDARAKRFCTSWTLTLDRLHKAITGFGYLIVSSRAALTKQRSGATSSRASSCAPGYESGEISPPLTPQQPAFAVLRGFNLSPVIKQRLEVLDSQRRSFMSRGSLVPTFTFPATPLAVTVMAAALSRLGLETQVDDIVQSTNFDVNTLLMRMIGLQAFCIIADDYLKAAFGADNRVSVTALHAREEGHSSGGMTLEEFSQRLRDACASTTTVPVVHFDAKLVQVVGDATPFGTFGIVIAAEDIDGVPFATVADANSNKFQRTWQVPIATLFAATAARVSSRHRTRGMVLFTKEEAPVSQAAQFDLSLVPLQNTFLMSTSAQIQGLSLAFAQLGHFYSPEELFYEAYLKTLTAHRRRGSQAVAWRTVEVSLAILSKHITAPVMAQVATRFLDSRNVRGIAVESLHDTMDPSPAELRAVCEAAAPDRLVLFNYDVQAVHGIPGAGHSVGLLESYDPATDTVGVFEAEFTLYGLHWRCPLEQLARACTMADTGNYGVVSIGRVPVADDDSGAPPTGAVSFNAAAF